MFDCFILKQSRATATEGTPATAETLSCIYASNNRETNKVTALPYGPTVVMCIKLHYES
jgi:hypothetical protein